MDPSAPVSALVLLAAGLLVLAGLAKLRVPDGAMATLHRLRLPSGRVAARVLGLGEVLLGVTVALVGGWPAALAIAVAYTAFTVVAAWQRSQQLDCGCFGTSATAVTSTHVALDAVAAVAGLAGLAAPPWSLADIAADAGGLALAAGLLTVAVGAWLLQVLLTRAADRQVLTPAAGRSA